MPALVKPDDVSNDMCPRLLAVTYTVRGHKLRFLIREHMRCSAPVFANFHE